MKTISDEISRKLTEAEKIGSDLTLGRIDEQQHPFVNIIQEIMKKWKQT